MLGPTAAQKTRMTLTRYNVSQDGTVSIDSGKTFSVMLNPAELTHNYTINYNDDKTLGQLASEKKFADIDAEKISFSLTLDGTGVVPPAQPGQPPKDVKVQIEELCKVVYQYEGTRHEPGRVRLLWGTLIFFGRLESMSTKFTLFKPSGDPLRAKLDLGFVGAMSRKEAQLVANQSSPDLSHLIEVRQGDTLPLLCERVYGDPSYYWDVARFNNLVDFRNLKPGGKLHFPPLE